MSLEEIKDFSDLLQFVIGNNSNFTQKDIAKKMGISWASFSDIKKGKGVGTTLVRKLRSFVRSEYDFDFKQLEGNLIQIVKKQVTHIPEKQNGGNVVGPDGDNNNNSQELKLKELEIQRLMKVIINQAEEIYNLKAKVNETKIQTKA